MLSTVLIVITLGHTDAPHVSFSTADNATACAAKAKAVTGILKDAGYRIATERCIETDLALTPYDHGATEMTAAYRLTLPSSGGGTVEPLAALPDCQPAPEADPAVWCAVSSQKPMK